MLKFVQRVAGTKRCEQGRAAPTLTPLRVLLVAGGAALGSCAHESGPLAAPDAGPGRERAAARLKDAVKLGYTVVDQNGALLYCRSDWATGSHIQKNTVCLTAQQLDDLSRRNDRDYSIPNRAPIANR